MNFFFFLVNVKCSYFKISESLVSLPHQFQQKTFLKGLNLQKCQVLDDLVLKVIAPPPHQEFLRYPACCLIACSPCSHSQPHTHSSPCYLLPFAFSLYLPFFLLSSLTLGIPIHFYIGNFAYIFVVSFHSLSTCFIFHRPGNLSKDLDPSLNSGSS